MFRSTLGELLVNLNSPKSLVINLPTIRFWLSLVLVIWLLGFIGLGWLVKSFLVLVGLLLISPVVIFLGFRWWLQRNLVQSPCPVCNFELTGLKGTQTQCPNCGESLQAENQKFQRLTPPGTIDVQAVDVSAQTLEDS
jgi:predicted RNA-binding Zn-ribbon protein involved in translation (DUF1610 family)